MLYKYLLITIILFILELCYFKVAIHFKIADKPNKRSSHDKAVIRGGGIILAISSIIWFFVYGLQYPYFIIGLIIVALLSFLDDLKSLPISIRLIAHILATFLMIIELGMYSNNTLVIMILIFMLSIFIINSYNFMDGINGIMCGYSLTVLIPLIYINHNLKFIDYNLIIICLLANIVFGFFNFRKHSKCFAGDVGSISMGFIIAFILSKLILNTKDFSYIILFIIYGIDTILTIGHRILLHENITTTHRKHIYQIMANELQIPQLKVALIYITLQALLSTGFILIPNSPLWHWAYLITASIILNIFYLLFIKKYYHLHRDYLNKLK